MGKSRPSGKTAEKMDRTRDVGQNQLGAFKGFRAGKRETPELGVFKGTRVGNSPDRSQKDMSGVTMPGREAGVPTFKPNLNANRKPAGPNSKPGSKG